MANYRPRIDDETTETLQSMREYIAELEEEGKDVSDYKGKKNTVTDNHIIKEALEALQQRGIVPGEED